MWGHNWVLCLEICGQGACVSYVGIILLISRVVIYAYFFPRMCQVLLTLDTIDSLSLVYLPRNWNALSIKYQSYPKSAKIESFELKMHVSQPCNL